MSRDSQATRWCFTLNNWTEEEWRHLAAELTFRAKCWIMGKEVAASGTPHLQGFFILKVRDRIGPLKEILGTRIHLEKARGTSAQAWEYCKKEGDFTSHGQVPGTLSENGLAAQLERAKEAVDHGCSLEDLWDQHFLVMVKYEKALVKYWMIKAGKIRRIKPRVEVIWGLTGTGKTRYVHDFARIFYEDDLWVYSGGGWFDGYIGQRVALFDDYYGDIPFGLFLKVLDRYKVRVPIKGGFADWNPEKIFVTSNKHPLFWYEKLNNEQQSALLRRFDKDEFVESSLYE